MDLQDDDGLWYKYEVDYEEISKKPGNKLFHLLDAFQGKGRKDELGIPMDELKVKTEEEIRPILQSAYAKWLWRKYKSGDHYPTTIDNPLFTTDAAKGIIVEQVDAFKIMWNIQSEMRVAGDRPNARVYGKKDSLAQPIILLETNGIIEARALQNERNFIRKKLGALGIQKVKPTYASTEVSKNIEQLLLQGTEDMRVISVHFVESAFPDKSRLTISNDLGVHQDIAFMKRKELLPSYSVTEMKSLELKLLESGQKFKLTVHLKEDSYRLTIDNARFSEIEREGIRQMLAKVGIQVDVEYRFRIESDLSTIFHKILARSKSVYDQFYGKLPPEYKDIIRELVYFEDETNSTCVGCGLLVGKNKSCPKCGCTDIKDQKAKHLRVDKKAVRDMVYKKLRKMGKQFEIKTKDKDDKRIRHFLNCELEKVDSSEIKCTFTRMEDSNTAPRTLNVTFSVVMNSGETIPARYDDDIRNVGLVTFGDAIFRERGAFNVGTINLLDLLAKKTKELRELFIDMVDSTYAHLEERILPLSSDGCERLIKGVYDEDGKDFERDIFYILKRLFPLSARYGRIGSVNQMGSWFSLAQIPRQSQQPMTQSILGPNTTLELRNRTKQHTIF